MSVISLYDILEPYQSRDFHRSHCTFLKFYFLYWIKRYIHWYLCILFFLSVCVHTGLTDGWTSRSQPSPSTSTKRWNNIRGEHGWCTKHTYTKSSFNLTCPYCTIAVFIRIHTVKLLFLGVRCSQNIWMGTFYRKLQGSLNMFSVVQPFCNIVKVWMVKTVLRKAQIECDVVLCGLGWSYQLQHRLCCCLSLRTFYKTLSYTLHLQKITQQC